VNDLLIFVLLFSAIAIGWWLGRRGAARALPSTEHPSQYYTGLNYLLDGRPDGAIDAFVDALEVNSETLETHLALGNLLRKRGEVDRAIRVHQNLLARPSLPREKVHQAHLELARDYISAGLLDRAERLLLDLVKESREQRVVSLRHLLEIYTSEKEWQKAIDAALQLLPRKTLLGGAGAPHDSGKGQQVAVALAHFYCELAASKLAAGELPAARKLLDQALGQDGLCVRASIMLGEVEYKGGHYKQAVKALRRVRQQDLDYLPETVSPLRKCYQQLNDEGALKTYLRDCLGENPPPKLLLAVAEDICEAGGKEAAADFLSNRLAHQPSLRGLAKLIELQIDVADDKSSANLGLLQVLVNRLVNERPLYRCGHCGFSGRQLHWFCPGCQYWGTIKSIQSGGLE
jgi:lipopolysaccharide biosynthesis regulator YciM